MIASMCSEPQVLEVMRIINTVLFIIKIVVPLILIITSMIGFMKAITNDKDGLKESLKVFVKKAIAAIIIFLIPTFINLIVKVTSSNTDYINCLTVRTKEDINAAYEAKMQKLIKEAEESNDPADFDRVVLYLGNIKNQERREEYTEKINEIRIEYYIKVAEESKSETDYKLAVQYLKEIKDEEKKQEYSSKLEVVENQITPTKNNSSGGGGSSTNASPQLDPGTGGSCKKHDEFNQCSPVRGSFGSFAYYDREPNTTTNRNSLVMDPAWSNENILYVSKTCSNGVKITFRINKLAKTTFEKALDGLCKIGTDGIDGIKYDLTKFTWDGSFYPRFISNSKSISNHSWGTAIDINQNYVDPQTGIKPFCYQCRDNYNSFVKTLGKEDDPRNVNYQLFKLIFGPLGFDWGGLWESPFDGVHFEVKY